MKPIVDLANPRQDCKLSKNNCFREVFNPLRFSGLKKVTNDDVSHQYMEYLGFCLDADDFSSFSDIAVSRTVNHMSLSFSFCAQIE